MSNQQRNLIWGKGDDEYERDHGDHGVEHGEAVSDTLGQPAADEEPDERSDGGSLGDPCLPRGLDSISLSGGYPDAVSLSERGEGPKIADEGFVD